MALPLRLEDQGDGSFRQALARLPGRLVSHGTILRLRLLWQGADSFELLSNASTRPAPL